MKSGYVQKKQKQGKTWNHVQDGVFVVTSPTVSKEHPRDRDIVIVLTAKALGASFETIAFKEEQITLHSGSPQTFQHQSESRNTITKEFYPKCGSTVFGSNLVGQIKSYT